MEARVRKVNTFAYPAVNFAYNFALFTNVDEKA